MVKEEYSNSVSLHQFTPTGSSHQSLISEVARHLSEVDNGDSSPDISEILSLSGYSNKVLRLYLADGQSVIIKRSQYEWAGPRFESARRATELVNREGSVIAPEHILLENDATSKPTLVYWFLPMPTLKALWPDLSPSQRAKAVRSLGHLLKKVHQIKVDQYGALAGEKDFNSISAFMENDLCERLTPAIWGQWPDAGPLADHLAHLAAGLPDDEAGIPLVHNDLHLDNILCEADDEDIRCVGLLDWEASGGGRLESDLASAIILHDPLFAEESGKGDWEEDFDRYLIEGYGETPNPEFLRFFKVYHLLNLGFFSALSGDDWHARRVADAIRQVFNSDEL